MIAACASQLTFSTSKARLNLGTSQPCACITCTSLSDTSKQKCVYCSIAHLSTVVNWCTFTQNKREATDNCKSIQDISKKVAACSLFQSPTTKCTVMRKKKKKSFIKILIEHCSFLTYHSFDILVTDEVPGWMKHSEKFSDRHTTGFQRQSDQASVLLSQDKVSCMPNVSRDNCSASWANQRLPRN